MFQIDLNKQFTDLQGKPIDIDNVALTLANTLATHNENTAKCMTWATELVKTNKLEIDAYDLDWVKNMVSNHGMSNLLKHQILNSLVVPPYKPVEPVTEIVNVEE